MRIKGKFVGLLCLLFLAAPLTADITYITLFEGVPPGRILKDLQEVSELIQLKSHSPSSVTSLRRRADRDITPFTDMLHSFGYYDVFVTYDIEERTTYHVVRLSFELGPLYTLSSYDVRSVATHPEAQTLLKETVLMPDPHLNLKKIPYIEINIKINKAAIAKELVNSKEALLLALTKRSYPLAQIIDETYVVDRSLKTVAASIFVNSGPKLFFGPTTISGADEVLEEFIAAKISWTEGELYNPEKIEATRENLARSRLFSSALITTATLPSDGTSLPISIELSESKHRSIDLGVSFTTDLGPGLSVEWEHRNMRRMGERLNFLGEIEGKQQRLRGLYRKPDFKRIDQDLIFSSELRSKKTDNFSEKSLSASTLIDRKINANLRVSYGGSIKYLATSQSDNNQNRTLISTPVKLRWSTTDDPLDPTTGIIFTTNGSPYLAVPMADLIYLKNRTTLSAYKSITNDKTLLLAGKITIGSIIGASRSNIPPPDRFYAGSESLLRGYDRLSVSPLSPKGKPLGGRSMAIGNIELRVRASENLGWIAFFEIGNVWSTVLPHFGGKLLKSTGAGIRYRTPIGPVRLDVAFPLNPRKGIDDSWEAYLNIGQAF